MLCRMKKRGIGQLQYFIISTVIAVIIFLALIAFISKSSSGDLTKKQALAKQIALLIDASQPGTAITLDKKGFVISASGNRVVVSSKDSGGGYDYEFFVTYAIKVEDSGDKAIIRIS